MTGDSHPFYAPAHPDDPLLFVSHGGHTMDGATSGSWQAYREAHALGFGAFQVDLVATGDERLVSRHTVFGRVRRWERRSGDALNNAVGPEQPTLTELFARWPDLRWNIEIKSSRCLEPLSAALAVHPHPELLCISAPFHTRTLRRLRARHPSIATNASLTEGALFGFPIRRLDPSLPATGIQLWKPFARPRAITRLRRRYPVQVWTINDADAAEALLKLGVSGLVVDDLIAVRSMRKPSGSH